MRYIIITLVFLASCNPCKYVSKHPECFPADTVIVNKETIHHEKIFIKNDSIIRDTVPCDPITNTYYKTNTVYQTKTIEKTDTIFEERRTTKLNPLNISLQKERDRLENKLQTRNKVILGLIIVLAVLIIIFKFLK